MGMKIMWRFESDSWSVDASNTADGYLATNVKKNTLSSKWQDDGTTSPVRIRFDSNASVSPNSITIIGHNIAETDLVELKFSDDPDFLVDVTTIGIVWRENIIYQIYTSPPSSRYARLGIAKGPGQVRYIGRLVIGDSYDLTYSLKAPGYKIGAGKTTTRTVRTQGGQLYADMGSTLKQMKGKIPGLPQADHDELQELIDTNQTGIPFIAAAEYDTFPEQKTIYGTFDTIPSPTDVTINRWEYPWSMTEQK